MSASTTAYVEYVYEQITKLDEREMAQLLPMIAHRCGQLGLFKTMHALNNHAVHAVGFEVAERIEAAEHTAELDAERRATGFKKLREGR